MSARSALPPCLALDINKFLFTPSLIPLRYGKILKTPEMVDYLRLDGFFPALGVPIESAPTVTLAFLCLLLAIFTLTLRPSLIVVHTRLLLCTASSYWFWRFGYGFEAPTRLVESGMAIICMYGIYRNLETSLGYSFEPIPRWVVKGRVQSLPSNFLWRGIWSLDLLFSMRGTSYLPHHTYWNFVPAALIQPKHNKPRATFLKEQALSLLGQFLLIDFFDTTIKQRVWETIPLSYYPITSLPLFAQLYFAMVVCIMTALSISVPYTALSFAAVALGSSPASWPPLFDDPFHATSLQSFWTHRWHASFRRIFLMVSSAMVDASHSFLKHPRARAAFRGLCIFLLSCGMHLGLMYRIRPPTATASQMTFFEKETLLFFLLQPVGMLLEVVAVKPLANILFGSRVGDAVICTRIWAWVWLLWTGRYWSDVWVRHGLWAPSERVVGYSLFRGIMYGEWVQ